MARKKGSSNKNHKIIPVKTLSPADLVKLVSESGIPVAQIEKGIGMPKTTLDKCLKAIPDPVTGYVRTLPAKYEAPLIKFIKEKKAEKEDLKIEVKEVMAAANIEVKEEEVEIPDEQRKRDWIAKLLEEKNMFQ